VVADASGLLFLQQTPGTGNTTILNLLPEKYLKGKVVNDFIEFELNTFLVTCLNDEYFYIVSRSGAPMIKIRSLNTSYISMGM